MAYAQWVAISITAQNLNVTIKNVALDAGKFYANGNKDKEIPKSDIEGHIINVGETYKINSCGRSDAAEGTEGAFDIYDSDIKIGKYSWDCPWGSKTNKSDWHSYSSSYTVDVEGGNLDSGALGDITIKIAKK